MRASTTENFPLIHNFGHNSLLFQNQSDNLDGFQNKNTQKYILFTYSRIEEQTFIAVVNKVLQPGFHKLFPHWSLNQHFQKIGSNVEVSLSFLEQDDGK